MKEREGDENRFQFICVEGLCSMLLIWFGSVCTFLTRIILLVVSFNFFFISQNESNKFNNQNDEEEGEAKRGETLALYSNE